MESKTTKPRHVVAFAFPFGSHSRSLFFHVLKLAKAAPQVSFSFFDFPKSNEFHLAESKTHVPGNFKAYPLHHGVPAGHVYSGKSYEDIRLFQTSAADSMRRGIRMVVTETGLHITCLITDGLLASSADIAQEFNTIWIQVWVTAPRFFASYFYSDSIRKLCSVNGDADDSNVLEAIPGLSRMRIKDMPKGVVTPVDPEDPIHAYIINQTSKTSHQVSVIVMNSFEELNPESLNNDITSKYRNFVNIGIPTLTIQSELDSDAKDLFSWLDKQAPKSVAYISFGTFFTLPPHELTALAEAIEATGIPFVWSLKDTFKQHLPAGFLERTMKQGKIVPWAPQTLVLQHISIAVSITHFGWHSVCESVLCGVPLIGRPFFADNMLNGRTVEEVWRIGVTVDNGEFSKNGLIKNLEFVMESEEGKKLRQNVEAYKEVMLQALSPDGSATQDFNKLIEIIKSEP